MALIKSRTFSARFRAKSPTNVNTPRTRSLTSIISEKSEETKQPTALTAHTPKRPFSLKKRPYLKGEVSTLRRLIIAGKRRSARKYRWFKALEAGDLDRLFGGDDSVKTTKSNQLVSKKPTDTPRKPFWGRKNPKKVELNKPVPTENKNKLMKLFSRRSEPKVPNLVKEHKGIGPWLFDRKPQQAEQSPKESKKPGSYNLFKRIPRPDLSPKSKKARQTLLSTQTSPEVSERPEEEVQEQEEPLTKEKPDEKQLNSLEDLETMDELTDDESVCLHQTDLDDLYIENLALKEQHLQEETVNQQLAEGSASKNAAKQVSPAETQPVETGSQPLFEEEEEEAEELVRVEPQQALRPLQSNVQMTHHLLDWINKSLRRLYRDPSTDLFIDLAYRPYNVPGSPFVQHLKSICDVDHRVDDLAPASELPEPDLEQSEDLEAQVPEVAQPEQPLDTPDESESVSTIQTPREPDEESLSEFLGMKEEGWNLLCDVIEDLDNGEDPEADLLRRKALEESGSIQDGANNDWYWFYHTQEDEFDETPVEEEPTETLNTEQPAENSTLSEEQMSLVIVENTEVLEVEEVIHSDDQPEDVECPEGEEISLEVHLNTHQDENGHELEPNNKRYETPRSCRLYDEDKEIPNRWYYINNNYEERYNCAHLQRTGSVGVMPFHKMIQLEPDFFDELLNDIKLKLLILKVQLNKSRSDIRLLSSMSLSKSGNRAGWSFRRREIEDLIYRIGYNWDIMKSRYFQLMSAVNQANDVLLSAETVPEKAENSVNRINQFLKGIGWEYESVLNLLRVAKSCVMWDMRGKDDVNNVNRAPENQPLTNRSNNEDPEEDYSQRQTLDYETHFEHFWHINDLLAGLQRKVFEGKKVCRVKGNCGSRFPETVHLI